VNTVITCPNCKTQNYATQTTCYNCGTLINPAAFQTSAGSNQPYAQQVPPYYPLPPDPHYQQLNPYAQPYYPAPKQSNAWVFWLIGVLGVIILLCVGAYILFFGTIAGVGRAITDVLATPTRPAVSNSPAPSLAELVSQKEKLTDVQWDNFARTLRGKKITGWEGTVSNVDDNPLTGAYDVTVDVEEPAGGAAFDLRWSASEQEALRFSRGQAISVTGVIQDVECYATYCPIKLFDVEASTR
jgi:hypothetical protein